MQVLTTIIVVIHVIVSLALVVFILLHAGRGGGLSDMFGGGMGPSAMSGSTIVERNLDRMTVASGLIFTVTTVALTIIFGG
ncbi:MAG: preprotein translocase subunit SecG [Acidimicrobiia bacterium]